MSCRLVLAGAAALMFLSGCGFLTHPSEKLPATRPAEANLTTPDATAAAPATQPATGAAVSPGALASQTEAFAQAIQAQLERRNRAAASAAPNVAASTASSVSSGHGDLPLIDTSGIRWLEPQQHELTLMPKQDPAGPYPAPKEDLPALPPAVKTPEPAAAPGTTASRAAVQPRDTQANSDPLEAQLSQRIKDNPRDLEAAIQYQILQFLHGRPVAQAEDIASLSMEDREMLSALMDALINLRANARGGDNMLLSRKARPLLELADRIRAQSGLRIPTVALCDKIVSFGRYEPIAPERIVPGREVAVYCEVENFLTQLDDRGFWQTKLSQEMILYDERGQRVALEKREPVSDPSRNRRHDFYISRKLRLPTSLAPGQYTLMVSIVDQQANRMTESRTALRIPAPDVGRLLRGAEAALEK